MCSLEKTDIILGIPQLQAHNPEINQERSQDNKMPTIMWKKYKVKRKAESKKRKKSSNIKREKDSEIGNR